MKLNLDSINNINLFERLTGARVKDCLAQGDGSLWFLVEEGSIKKALGKDNSNINRVGRIMKKKIRIIGFSKDVCIFVRNLIYPNKVDDIKLEEKIVKIVVQDSVIKGRIFGRSRENLKKINDLVKNYFDVEEVKIV